MTIGSAFKRIERQERTEQLRTLSSRRMSISVMTLQTKAKLKEKKQGMNSQRSSREFMTFNEKRIDEHKLDDHGVMIEETFLFVCKVDTAGSFVISISCTENILAS